MLSFIKKSIYIICICLCCNACNINHAKNIQDCKFSFQSISNLRVNNLAFDGKRSLRDFSPADVAIISKGLMNDMPISLTAHVKIDNPNKATAELSALEWILLIKNVEVAKGVVNERTKIKSGESITVNIPVKTNTKVLKQFSLTEIKDIIFNITNENGMPENAQLKVKPAFTIGKALIKAPAFFTVDL